MKITMPSIETQEEITKQEDSGLFLGIGLNTRFLFKEGYESPTFSEVRTMQEALVKVKGSFSGADMATTTGVASTRTPRKWMADPTQLKDSSSTSKIPYAAWRLLIFELMKYIEPKEKPILSIILHSDCRECKKENSVKVHISISKEQGKDLSSKYENKELTSFWAHDAFFGNNSILVACEACKTVHNLEIGSIELHCHPELEIGSVDLYCHPEKVMNKE